MSQENYFVEVRRKQKKELLENLKKRPKEEHEFVLSAYCNHTGLKRTTVQRMYEELVEARMI